MIGGLTNGERFTFTVAAADSSGRGPPSAPSNSVTPEPLATFTSTVSIRSVSAMFNGGACVDQGSQCFGIQQNSFVNSANGEYWVQNLVFVEDSVQHGWEAEGNYQIWNGTQQSILACSGTILSGPNGQFCQWPMKWRPLKFPARITLTSTVADGNVVLKNSLGNSLPAWSPGPGGIDFIVDPHEMAVDLPVEPVRARDGDRRGDRPAYRLVQRGKRIDRVTDGPGQRADRGSGYPMRGAEQ